MRGLENVYLCIYGRFLVDFVEFFESQKVKYSFLNSFTVVKDYLRQAVKRRFSPVETFSLFYAF